MRRCNQTQTQHCQTRLSILVFAGVIAYVYAFQVHPTKIHLATSKGNSLSLQTTQSCFRKESGRLLRCSATKQSEDKSVRALKEQLISSCGDRTSVESIIDELALYNPTEATSSSNLLQRKWELVWTTEKEINFFLDIGIADNIYQTIDGTHLENLIQFRNGGSFGVSGKLTPSDGIRTEFTFETATLDLKWASFQLPPVGKGWFDTVFLDEELRVDRNSRNDILICLC